MQGVEVVNGAQGRGPGVSQDLEDVEVVAQSVRSHQQHPWEGEGEGEKLVYDKWDRKGVD